MSVLICFGCRKKQQQDETPSDTETTSSAESNTVEPVAQNPVVDSNITQLEELTKPVPPQRPDAAGTIEQGSEIDLKQFASLSDSDAKIDWISEFADAHPDRIAEMAATAINDKDVEVRIEVMETLIDNEVSDALGVIKKAMKDREEEVRQLAAEACEFVEDKQAGPILIAALADKSEIVRETALEITEGEDNDTKLSIYKAAITSKYEDVKEEAVSVLFDMSSPLAVDILLEGLKDPDPDFRQDVIDSLDFLIDQEFASYQEAKKWWDANRKRFDEELVEMEEP